MNIYDALSIYWGVSHVWHRGQGNTEKPLTVEKAIRDLNSVRAFCKGKRGPALKIEQRATKLLRSIVYRSTEEVKSDEDIVRG